MADSQDPSQMRASEVRNWLGIYFLAITGGLSAYVLIFPETKLLPIRRDDAGDVLQIILPVLIAQIILIYKWFSRNIPLDDDKILPLPRWVVQGPPIMITVILGLAIVAMIFDNLQVKPQGFVKAGTFKNVVTFCVTLLNASTVFLVLRFFDLEQTGKGGSQTPRGPRKKTEPPGLGASETEA